MVEYVQKIRVNRVDEPKVRIRVKPRVPPLEIELQNTGTEIQWRIGTTGTWQTLIPLDDINSSVTIGSVTTLSPGNPATVVNVGTPQDVVLNFGIPRGMDGTGLVISIVAGQGIAVDNSDVTNPVVSVDATAAEIPFSPTGGLSATNVQAALAELDTEKQPAGSYQPLDTDLTAIAALATTSYGRSLLTSVDAPTLFAAIKQAATAAATGVVELATDAEAITGTDTSRAITPANLAAVLAAHPSATVTTFTSSGTWTKAGGSLALVECWGAGGSGSRGGTSSNGGGGGGGGAYSSRLVLVSALAATETVTVGAGGAAITTNNTIGQQGGNSSFGSWLVGYGGAGGRGVGGAGGAGGGGGGQGSAGSATAGGGDMLNSSLDVTNLGGNGGGGSNTGASSPAGAGGATINGGGGGGGGPDAGGGGNVGGKSGRGGGGGGGGGAAAGTSVEGGSGSAGTTGTTAATAGASPGGGGGGSYNANSGAGGGGRVRITVW